MAPRWCIGRLGSEEPSWVFAFWRRVRIAAEGETIGYPPPQGAGDVCRTGRPMITVALRNHDSNLVLGRRSASTLDLRKDAAGLHVELQADAAISYVADLARNIQRGDAHGGSFGFRVEDDVWSLRDGLPYREIIDMHVKEVSLGVPFPAYGATRPTVGADMRPHQA